MPPRPVAEKADRQLGTSGLAPAGLVTPGLLAALPGIVDGRTSVAVRQLSAAGPAARDVTRMTWSVEVVTGTARRRLHHAPASATDHHGQHHHQSTVPNR